VARDVTVCRYDNGDGVSAVSASLQVKAIPQSAIEFAALSAYHPAAVALFFAESHRPKNRTSSRRGGRSLAQGQSAAAIPPEEL